MPERHESGPDACPVCGAEPDRLGVHWQECEYPSLPSPVDDLLTGALLSGARLRREDGPPWLELSTTDETTARWVFNELDVLGDVLERTEYRSQPTRYTIRTRPHEALQAHWDRWYVGGTKRFYPAVTLNPTVVRVWTALAGDLDWTITTEDQTPELRLRVNALDRAEAVGNVLDAHNFESREQGQWIVFESDAAREWLGVGMPPPPGQVHNWCLDFELSRAARDQTIIEVGDPLTIVYQSLLEFVEVVRDRPPRPAGMAAAFSESLVDEIKDQLGGGDWRDALSTAGIQSSPAEITRSASRGATTKYTEAEIIDAIQAAADALGEPLKLNEYKEWAVGTEYPVAQTVNNRYSWADICNRADVTPLQKGRWTNADCIEALRTAAEECGEPLRASTYREWAQGKSHPSMSTIAGSGESARFDSWQAAIDAAGLEPATTTRRWSGEAIVTALEDAAQDLGEPPSRRQYKEWAKDRPVPSLKTVHSGSNSPYELWSEAIEDVFGDTEA